MNRDDVRRYQTRRLREIGATPAFIKRWLAKLDTMNNPTEGK